MILWVLGSILVLFVFFSLIRNLAHKWFKIKVCAICGAVSLTWLTLLVLKFLFGIEINTLILGILMGESVTGIMYLFETKAKEYKKNKLLWLKVFIIIIGTGMVYLLLTQGFSLAFIFLSVVAVVLAIFILIKLRSKKSKKVVNKKYSRFSKEIKKLEEKFEHCCD